MKKLIGIVAAAALLASAAFAEVSFGSWLSSMYLIGSDESGNVVSRFAQPWGNDKPRFSAFTISGTSEHAGFVGEVQHNGYNWALGQSFTYVKPIEQIQLIFGFTDQNYLRSDNTTFQHDYARTGALGIGEGLTFDEFEFTGVGLVVKPIDSLTIVAGFDVPIDGTAGKLQEQIGRTGKLGVGYTIDGIGTIKAGVRATGRGYNKDGEVKDGVKLGAAFDLTAVDGLFVTVGAKIPLGGAVYSKKVVGAEISSTDNATVIEEYWYEKVPVEVNAGIALSFIENLNIKLNFGSKINATDYGTDENKDGFGFALELGADYAFGDGWTVFGAVGYANAVYNSGYEFSYKTKDGTTAGTKVIDTTNEVFHTKDCVSFGVGIEKAWSNARFGIEFLGATNYNTVLDSARADDSTGFGWMIPIKMNLSF